MRPCEDPLVDLRNDHVIRLLVVMRRRHEARAQMAAMFEFRLVYKRVLPPSVAWEPRDGEGGGRGGVTKGQVYASPSCGDIHTNSTHVLLLRFKTVIQCPRASESRPHVPSSLLPDLRHAACCMARARSCVAEASLLGLGRDYSILQVKE